MYTVMRRTGRRPRRWAGSLAAGTLLLAAFLTAPAASAAETPGATLINETFDAQTTPANFGFPVGAAVGNGVLEVTKGMGNYTTSVRPLASSITQEKTLDLRFDWKTAITSTGMKTGLELRDSAGRLVFGMAATAAEFRHAATGPDSNSTSAPDSLNPTWTKISFDRAKWYTVDLHMDFTLGKIQYTVTSKEAAPKVLVSTTKSITGQNLAKLVACNYYGTGVQSIDNFRLTRPANPAYGSLAGSSVYAFGDSIVYGHQYARSFVNFVAEREGMTLTKYARNGATVGPAPTASGGQILNQVKSASSVAPDFVVFDGGTNDAIEIHDLHTYEVGTVSGSQDPATLDPGTYAGALETTISTMRQKWPTAQLVYVAAHKMGSRDWDTQLALREVQLQVAQKWGVAVADVFGDTTLDTRVDAQRVAYTFDGLVGGYPGSGGSGTHPNIAGITDFFVPVLSSELSGLADTTALKARHSGKCAEAVGSSTTAGAAIEQAGCSGGDDQRWQLHEVGGGYYQILSRHSGLCLDVAGSSTANTAAIVQQTCDGRASQQWRLNDTGTGYAEIVARHSGKCLDVDRAFTADGTRLLQYTCWNDESHTNQHWTLQV
ncbi:RICIN domain-containing protein [Streptomyces caniscabiei]|uniref:RICIN domain-containing protein n=1 Tax=Streptomyces caniscabiei TaxID=2746961 RepID=UPI0029B2F4E9|nr:RICIN domain-containing protein [Streptomyces caniscabiei]MDX2737929.1 RICIN domain-containing protein [Streptomyces caniscabiei]MDX2777681.1 RICIN domain-containing protein [Streptomyces caniscabiei]